MILIQRAVPFLSVFLLFIFWELSLFYKEYYVWFFLALVFVVFVSLLQLFRWRFWTKEFLGFLVAPLFITLSAVLFLIFVEDAFLKQLVIGIHLLGCGLFFESCFAYLHHTEGYQPYALQNISSSMNVGTMWLFLSGAFALSTYFQISAWILLALVLAVTFVSTTQIIWIHKIPFRQSVHFLAVIVFIMGQMFWAMHYLPLSWLVSGFVLATFYYVVINMGRYYLLKSLQRSIVVRYTLLGSAVSAVVLATARWI